MKILVAEDEKISRNYLKIIASKYGQCDEVVNGEDTIAAVRKSIEEGLPYTIIFLDLMMPKVTGQEVLKEIRKMEEEKKMALNEKSKIIITTALSDRENVKNAYDNLANGYVVKPLYQAKIEEILEKYKVE